MRVELAAPAGSWPLLERDQLELPPRLLNDAIEGSRLDVPLFNKDL